MDYKCSLIFKACISIGSITHSDLAFSTGHYKKIVMPYNLHLNTTEVITSILKRDTFIIYDTTLMDFSVRYPVFSISMNVFIEKWLDFVAAAYYSK